MLDQAEALDSSFLQLKAAASHPFCILLVLASRISRYCNEHSNKELERRGLEYYLPIKSDEYQDVWHYNGETSLAFVERMAAMMESRDVDNVTGKRDPPQRLSDKESLPWQLFLAILDTLNNKHFRGAYDDSHSPLEISLDGKGAIMEPDTKMMDAFVRFLVQNFLQKPRHITMYRTVSSETRTVGVPASGSVSTTRPRGLTHCPRTRKSTGSC